MTEDELFLKLEQKNSKSYKKLENYKIGSTYIVDATSEHNKRHNKKTVILVEMEDHAMPLWGYAKEIGKNRKIKIEPLFDLKPIKS